MGRFSATLTLRQLVKQQIIPSPGARAHLRNGAKFILSLLISFDPDKIFESSLRCSFVLIAFFRHIRWRLIF